MEDGGRGRAGGDVCGYQCHWHGSLVFFFLAVPEGDREDPASLCGQSHLWCESGMGGCIALAVEPVPFLFCTSVVRIFSLRIRKGPGVRPAVALRASE